jgi:LmbE family N-acetylglucosaminyl deacetylase
VDVTDTFARKVAALRAHESQTGHLDDLAERLRTRLASTAGQAGLPDGRLAEAFQVLDTA